MENPSRKWKCSHLSSREAGRGVVACLLLLLFCITGCDTSSGGGVSEPTIHEPSDLAAFSKVLKDATAGISADGELVHFKLSWQLSPVNWNGIINALGTEGRYVSLDLSACTKGTHTEGTGLRSDGTFAPNGAPGNKTLADAERSPGKLMIVELVLPDQATKIPEGESKGGAFLYFLSLTKISGKNITEIGNNAFYMDPGGATPNLTEANFPKVTKLGNSAFSYCYELTEVSFPELTTIGNSAFSSCHTLKSVSLPKAQTLGNSVFGSCFKLTSIALPEATTIGNTVFQLCENLASVDLPKITTINPGTYNATGVPGGGVFTGCSSLVTLNIPRITDLGGQAFTLCENSAALTLFITMGATAPKVGENLFLNVNSPRPVIVKRPASGASGYTDDWQTNFKGKGWDGTAVIADNTVNNSNITLSVINL
ncbi:MAG: leucine-rich repeat domain-containing protein [Treponema sp.]|nr:leucine-rich repeat domain-containing protein [Treponema sp.]